MTFSEALGRVMVLDDDSMLVEAISVLLKEEGYPCDGFTDHRAAVEALAQGNYSVLILDYLLIGTTAQQVVEEIRSTNQDIYIILLTGFPANMPGRYAMEHLDIDAYCEKSMNYDPLLIQLATAMRAVVRRTGRDADLPSNISLKEKLKMLRVGRGKTQEEIAELLGVGRTTVVNYEYGRIRPTLESIRFLADYYNVSCDYLLDDFNKSHKNR